MVFGHNRIPIVAWLRSQAVESQAHAVQAGEHITPLGGHPPLENGPPLRTRAVESRAHAVQAGEHITALGEHPSLKIGPLLETHKHNVDEILREALAHEQQGLAEYRKLLDSVAVRP